MIVTSYVFRDGKINWENMEKLKHAVGKENVVIDLSCRKKEDGYYIVTDRWQKFTDVKLTQEVLREIAGYCDEYLVHGVDAVSYTHLALKQQHQLWQKHIRTDSQAAHPMHQDQ